VQRANEQQKMNPPQGPPTQVQQMPSAYKGKTLYMINAVKFEVDDRYVVQSARGSGAYGFVVYGLQPLSARPAANRIFYLY
jgi:hypothetical protein